MNTFNVYFRAIDTNDNVIHAGETASALVHGRGRVISSTDDHGGLGLARVEFDGDAEELASDERVESVTAL